MPDASGKQGESTGRRPFAITFVAILQIDDLLTFWPRSALTAFGASAREIRYFPGASKENPLVDAPSQLPSLQYYRLTIC